MKIARLFSAGSCLLFFSVLAFAPSLRAQQAAAAPCCQSALRIVAGSSVELLVTAPDGLRTGFNPVTGLHVNEIPSSNYYTGPLAENPGAFGSTVEVRKVQIALPAAGTYTVEAIGQEPGSFTVRVTAVNDKGVSHVWKFTGKATPDSTSVYRVRYSPDPSAQSAVTPLIALSSLSADVTDAAGPPPTFQVKARFSLGSASAGIDPLTEPVSFHLSTYSATIPAGSFKRTGQGSYAFSGTIEGVPLQVRIATLSTGKLSFQVKAQNIDMTHAINPVRFLLIVGNNAGSVLVNAVTK